MTTCHMRKGKKCSELGAKANEVGSRILYYTPFHAITRNTRRYNTEIVVTDSHPFAQLRKPFPQKTERPVGGSVHVAWHWLCVTCLCMTPHNRSIGWIAAIQAE